MVGLKLWCWWAVGSDAVVNEFWIRGKRERGILGFEKLNDFFIGYLYYFNVLKC